MKKSRVFLVIPLIAMILTLALVGGNWTATPVQAGHTIPPPPPPPGGGGRCGPSSILVKPDLHDWVGCLPWEADYPMGSICKEGTVTVWELPITGPDADPPPFWWKMLHYGYAFKVRYYVNGQLVTDPACANTNIRYYINSWQRYVYDHTPDMIQIHYLNMETEKWELCPTTLDTTMGAHGILVCKITDWGYFAIGHPSQYNSQ